MTSEGVFALHDQHSSYASYAEFRPELPALLQQGGLIDDCVELTRALGILEPLTGEHIPPEGLTFQGPNWRESIVGNGLLSRSRGVLWLLKHLYGSLETLKQQEVYLVEALSGFALWLRRQYGEGKLTCSEYLEDSEIAMNNEIPHENLCALSFGDESFDLVLCNELFEHVQHLDRAFTEIKRVLRTGGRLVATCPMAFGQEQSIVKAVINPQTGAIQLLAEKEIHGDPVRPEGGSLVYRIPAWDVLVQLRNAGFAETRIHLITSWKYGILGSDLPGVLVIEAIS